MQRVCFTRMVKADKMAEYVRDHENDWPDMLQALRDTGWHNYSLFLRDDGMLIGYFETPDLEAAVAGMEALEVNERWQQAMADYFVTEPGKRHDDEFVSWPQVFYLE